MNFVPRKFDLVETKLSIMNYTVRYRNQFWMINNCGKALEETVDKVKHTPHFSDVAIAGP